MNKYCRICWNTAGWRYPTGNANETHGSYVAENGFGHEEWLFNYEWLLDGYRYGFLQPIGKFRKKYMGNNFSVFLYTITPEMETLRVGLIDNLYIPTDQELSHAFRQMRRQGWIDQMVEDVQRVQGNSSNLIDPDPTDIANVRFRAENVLLDDPMPRVIGNHKILRIRRYHPFDWDDNEVPQITVQPPSSGLDDPRRVENERTRAAQEGTTYDPRHVRLQNRCYEFLIRKYGRKNVLYEQDFVDLIAIAGGERIFYEIKTENTAKKCIRNSIGQLLEYAHYPDISKAKRLVIVGDIPPRQEDITYLYNIRNRYQIPIFYGWFNWETATLDQVI